MIATSFDAVTRILTSLPSRRDILRGLAGMGLGLGSARFPGFVEAKKKRKRKKRRKNKKKCGKPGSQPVKGTCCKRSIRVDGRCQRCDVCARGCAFAAVQAAIDAADNGDTIALCPGTYRGDTNLRITKDLRLIGAGDGDGANDTIVLGPGNASVVFIAENVVSLEHLRITGGLGLVGGGIVTDAGTVELISCTVTENETVGHGGGIYNDAGTLTLRNSTIRENEAGTDAYGGGVYSRGPLLLIASDISGNRADYGGGLFNYIGATMTADAASRITANTATYAGGGIYNNGGPVTLASSAIVTGNTPNNCVGDDVPNCIG